MARCVGIGRGARESIIVFHETLDLDIVLQGVCGVESRYFRFFKVGQDVLGNGREILRGTGVKDGWINFRGLSPHVQAITRQIQVCGV